MLSLKGAHHLDLPFVDRQHSAFLAPINRGCPILYVEDDAACADHLGHLLKKIGSPHCLIHLSHGEDAISYLKREGKYADAGTSPIPGLILVDLKMPRVNGFELVEWIRKSSNVSWIPVVMLTVSEEIRDVQRAYRIGAQSFLIKPISAEDLTELLYTWEHYWLPKAFASTNPATVASRSAPIKPSSRPTQAGA
jgi:CheY-like chemotaxis protein